MSTWTESQLWNDDYERISDPVDKYDTADFHKLLTDMLDCHRKAELGKRNTMNTMEFETSLMENMVNLAHTVYDRTYLPSRGIAFINRDPVLREIFAAPFRDRVVHHYIYEKTIDWWISQFIDHTYSCIKGRGTLMAIEEVYAEMKDVSDNWTKDAYYIKLDLQGYFMSLNRKYLLREALRGLKEQYKDNYGFEYETLKFLWRQIIMDDPVRDAHFRNFPHDWKKLPKAKSLMFQKPGIGIVIGNLTSQLLSNIFLNPFDWFVTETLGWANYNRYVDDFVIIVRKEELAQALADVKRIEHFLAGMGLRLHPKKRQVQPIRHGLKFLGMRLYPGKIVAGERIRKNIIHALKQYKVQAKDGESIISYIGLLEHYDCEKLMDIIVHEINSRGNTEVYFE